MPKYRFVHLSDIHFGQNNNSQIPIHNDVRQEVLRDCALQQSELGQASGILVTGDTAFSGKTTQFQAAGVWLEKLTEVIGCQLVDVCVVPGNHDVDRGQIGRTGQIVHGQLRSVASNSVSAELESIMNDGEGINPLLPKLAAYRLFAARYSCDFDPIKPFWEKEYSLGEPYILRIVGLNSVLVSDSNDQLGQLILGNKQYVIQRRDNVATVVMLHHPPNWLKDGSEATRYFNRHQVIMFGHQHELAINKISDEIGKEHLEIEAGACNPPEVSETFIYQYNWIEFDLEHSANGVYLSVTIYPRVWEPSRTCFVPNYLRLDGKKSATIKLACPHITKLPNLPALTAVTTTFDSARVESTSVGARMTTGESFEFDRLSFFFWKYLDWNERVQVLNKIGVLPTTAQNPASQTMERVALDRARRQGKLLELWAAIMAIVPEDKREPNPFVRDNQ